jgi:RIO-like serine/threonine protein kinase
VAFDSLPSKRRSILRKLYGAKAGVPLDDLSKTLRLPKQTCKYAVEDMELLELLDTEKVQKKTEKGNTVEVLMVSLAKQYRMAMERIIRYTGGDF